MFETACRDWKRIGGAIAAVFVVSSVADAVIHGVLLAPTYAATAALWRPMDEMKMGLMYVVTLLVAAAFVKIYAFLVSPRTLGRGALFGLLWGAAAGVSMGYGTYAVMPIPYHLALAWFVVATVQGVLAGLVVGAIVKDAPKA